MTKLTIVQKPKEKKPVKRTPGTYYRRNNNERPDIFCIYLLTAVSQNTRNNDGPKGDVTRWFLINIETGTPYNLNSESIDEAFNGQMDQFTQIESIHITVG